MSKQSNEPIQVTKQQMIDYIFSQPDDRKVHFGENWSNQDCGCIMVQYGRDKGFEFYGCGCTSWEGAHGLTPVAVLDVTYDFFQPNWKHEFSYAEIKEYLLSKGCKPTEAAQ